MHLDIPRRQAQRIEGEDLVVEPRETPLRLPDDLWLKASIPIMWGVDADRDVLAAHSPGGAGTAVVEHRLEPRNRDRAQLDRTASPAIGGLDVTGAGAYAILV
jgi:hypothetical protein